MHKASYQEILDTLRVVGRGQRPDARVVATAAEIGLLEPDSAALTPAGKHLLEDGLLRDRPGVVEDVLREQSMLHPATRALVEGEWGQEITRPKAIQIMNYAYPPSRSWVEADFGRFFSTLNFVGVITYSKKQGTVRVNTGPPGATPHADGTLISPSTPYRNKRLFGALLGAANTKLWWFDSHLDRKGLQFLYEEANWRNLKEVRILSCGRSNITDPALDDYRRLKEELASRAVTLEWRLLLDREDLTDKHDRWIRADNKWWNVPPLSAVMANKSASLLEDRNLPPFEDWWNAATEISAIKPGA
jgi:hypothetical protein